MSFTARTYTPQRKKRVIIVARPSRYLRTLRYAPSAVMRSLLTPPKERDALNTEAILSLMNNWPEFTNYISDVKLQKEVCKFIEYLKYDDGEPVYRKNDISDGWYFILSGECDFIEECSKEDINTENFVDIKNIHSLFGYSDQYCEKYYRKTEIKTNPSEFGLLEMKKRLLRKNSCIAVGKTELLRIDPFTFEMAFSSYKRALIAKKISLITNNSKFSPLLELNDVQYFLAKQMKEIILKEGMIIEEQSNLKNGVLFIETGEIQVSRVINFDRIGIMHYKLMCAEKEIQLPKGIQEIPTSRLTDNDVLALQGMYKFNTCPFISRVKKTSKCFLMEYDDFFAFIPMNFQKKILKKLLDDRNEQKIAEDWIDNQKVKKWRSYKNKCYKEARDYIKASKDGEIEKIIERRPKQPKSARDYRPSCRANIARRSLRK